MLQKIASLGVIQLAGILINIVRTKVFAVLLGPAGFGVVATIDQLILSVVQISNLSLPFTALKYLSRSHSLGEEQFRKSYSAFFKALALLALVAMVVAVTFLPPILDHLDPQIAPFRDAVTVALIGIPATMMLIFFVNVLAARQESTASVVLTVLSSAVILIAGTVGCLLSGIRGIYVGVVASSTLLMIAVVIFLWRRRNMPAWGDSSGVWKDLTRNLEIVWITLFVFFAVASAAVQLFLSRYAAITQLGAEAAGYLQACLAIALTIGAVLGPANALYFIPYVNRAIPAAEKVAVADRFLPRLIMLCCFGALAILLFPRLVLNVLFSSEFAPAIAILPLFVAWQGLYQFSNVYQQLLIGLDDVQGYGLVTSVGNLAAAGLSLLLVSRYELLGIAFGFVGGVLITAVLTGLRLHSKHRLRISWGVSILVLYAIAGLSLVTMAGHLTAELSLTGLVARALTALVFLTGLWVALPRPLRSELMASAAGRWRALMR